jgi:hypothetical protein
MQWNLRLDEFDFVVEQSAGRKISQVHKTTRAAFTLVSEFLFQSLK